MGEATKIQWTDHTFNAWWGCTKVSAGCDNCYAEAFDKRLGGKHWGAGIERKVFKDKHWAEPLRWNATALKAGKRARVFCSSMADVFDAEAPAGQLERLWALICETTNLDWQLLTKRPHRIAQSLPADWGVGYPNVWLGTTVENQEQAELRIPRLLAVPARLRFLSCEPLLGPVDLSAFMGGPYVALPGDHVELNYNFGLSWVIIGGESGRGARPFDGRWAGALVRQCRSAGVACFVKQLGAAPMAPIRLEDGKGGNWDEWPADLRVRQFPVVTP